MGATLRSGTGWSQVAGLGPRSRAPSETATEWASGQRRARNRALCLEAGQAGSNRGVDIYKLRFGHKDFEARDWRYLNPQTQEEFQAVGN